VGTVVLLLVPSTLSDVMFVLGGKVYGDSYSALCAVLRAVMALPLVIRDREVVETAVGLFVEHHRDWDDCLLAAYATHLAGGALYSFDRGLDRIPGLARRDPVQPRL
jgi:predicted nucleic acid-binding protein